MEQTKASAKDFFLHLGAMVALYTVTISFLNLIFKIINHSFPEVASQYYYFGGGSEISLPVATLIVVFPIFVLLSRMVHAGYEMDEAKKGLAVRRWLTYITLFIAGIILAGDLVTALYKFLDGQELTVAFLLKALAVLIVSGAVFGFYIQDIRDRVSRKSRNLWAIVISIIILVSIILGFSVLGSPMHQRLVRGDNQKIIELQNTQWQVINYWQMNGSIPETMQTLPAGAKYKKTGQMTFELCAEFKTDGPGKRSYGNSIYPMGGVMYDTSYPVKGGMMQNDNWDHQAGRKCFERVIDPVIYPTQVRG